MEISDIKLNGIYWNKAFEGFKDIFKERKHYQLYLLATAVGIMYDKKIERFEESENEPAGSVPRNVIHNNDNSRLEFLYQAAILSSKTFDFTEDERLDLAFSDNVDEKVKKYCNKWFDFLTPFANFGIKKICETIGSTNLETMDNLKNFLVLSAEGKNFDINGLNDIEIYE